MTRVLLAAAFASATLVSAAQDAAPSESWLGPDFKLANVVPPLEPLGEPKDLPYPDTPFIEHVRTYVPGDLTGVTDLSFDGAGNLVAEKGSTQWIMNPGGEWGTLPLTEPDDAAAPKGVAVADSASWNGGTWYATDGGLYVSKNGTSPAKRHDDYGVDGPLATKVRAVEVFGGALYIGTALGLTVHKSDGTWSHIRGREGLPYEDVTALEDDGHGGLWIGTTNGAILYRPADAKRKWYFRWGQRYLPGNHVTAIACAEDGTPYFATDGGIGAIELKRTTRQAKAKNIERLVNERHRRFGLVSESILDDAHNPSSHIIEPQPNDGLWTAYHVAAMSLAYGATKDPAAKASAKEGMHALYMLQNVSGIPGLAARSFVTAEEGKRLEAEWKATATPEELEEGFRWRPSPDGKHYWWCDVSSDEMDGHFLAFYTYWTHIAKDDPEERDRCIEQARTAMNYIVDNGYKIIDWNGKRTLWGVWNPEALNDDPERHLENGLNSLQLLSFLKTAHTVTGDAKFEEHYRKLIVEHGYLSNLLLSKKVFPDEQNHSDDQLGHVAWYPILQQEHDPKIRAALHAGIRRHYTIVEREKPSFYTFIYATIDPNHANIAAGLENLAEIPEDRRQWRMQNSHRADVVWDTRLDRFGEPQLLHAPPADERNFRKWNRNPYVPDEGGDGTLVNDGAAYLLPYWMARYHGFLAAAE